MRTSARTAAQLTADTGRSRERLLTAPSTIRSSRRPSTVSRAETVTLRTCGASWRRAFVPRT
ncbi:hypothetical protein [Streptomyces sp. NBC_00162]|uniref:hypothetical protein n=1 Tax=Streptomyces sp. NBC_00162 TaxID=2903629 RepID=UPI00214B9790|nr:hypothetical protein [Streptomyces sp. NBC_00162]UUU38028.1 hypothetical protein JIW86_03630 [Streptomyces sp. NBC_00162]